MLIVFRSKRYGFERQDALFAYFFGICGILIGAKALSLAGQLPNMWRLRKLLFTHTRMYFEYFFNSGLVFYGGLIGGLLMAVIYCRKYKLNTLYFLDLSAPAIAVGHSVARIGCFMVGCCYGKPTDSSFGVIFNNSPVAPHDVHLLPVQLFESALNMILFITLMIFSRKQRKSGSVIGLYIVLYSIIRFLLEFLRGDDARGFILFLSTSQLISLVILPIGIFLLAGKRTKSN